MRWGTHRPLESEGGGGGGAVRRAVECSTHPFTSRSAFEVMVMFRSSVLSFIVLGSSALELRVNGHNMMEGTAFQLNMGQL